MALGVSDIKFFFSGGITNNDPASSLGGEISTFFMGSRLFADVSKEEALEGKTDYRCFYIQNISETETFYNMSVSLTEVAEGATATMGIEVVDDVQHVYITNGNVIETGSFVLRIYSPVLNDWVNFEVDHDFGGSYDWSVQFELALRDVPGFEGATVEAVYPSSNMLLFMVTFSGVSGNRYYETMEFVSADSIFEEMGTSFNIVKFVSGGPFLRVADEIDMETTPPTGIAFDNASVSLGDFRPGEFFPIWIKREIEENTAALEADGFDIKLNGTIS